MIYDLTAGGTSTDPYAGLDRFGRVIDSRWVQEAASSSEEATDVERVQYGYDRASNRLWRHNVVASEQYAGGNDELYAYDGLQRLIDMARGNLNELRTAVDDASFSQNWQLDASGNWPGFRQMNVADPTQNLDQQRSANQANEVTALDRRYGVSWAPCAYDRAGNTTTFPQPVDPESGFDATYDAWNRLVQLSDGESTVATYAYDGFNWRTKKVTGGVTRHYYYSSQWQVLEERLGATPASADAERQFLWGLRYIDDLVLRDRDTDASGTLDERLYALQDANWNVTAVTDPSGVVQERYRYSPYGEPTFLEPDFTPREINVSDFDWDTLYTGQRFENESDLYLYRNRYYHAELGRFVIRDPIGYENSLSLYEYVKNSPMNWLDPLGLQGQGRGWPKDCGEVLGSKGINYAADLARHLRKKISKYLMAWDKQDIGHYNLIQQECKFLKEMLDLIAKCCGPRDVAAQKALDLALDVFNEVANECDNPKLGPPKTPIPKPDPIPLPPPLTSGAQKAVEGAAKGATGMASGAAGEAGLILPTLLLMFDLNNLYQPDDYGNVVY